MIKPRFTLLLPLILFLGVCPFAKLELAAQTTEVSSQNDRQRGIDLFQQKRIPEAIKALRAAVKKTKNDSEAWYFLGLALLREPKEIKNASKAFETVLRIQPNHAKARVSLSYSLLLRNKPSDAIRQAEGSLLHDPKIAEAHYIIAVVRLREGASEDALRHADEALKLDPQLASVYLIKSQALMSDLSVPPVTRQQEGRERRILKYRNAAEALERYLQLNPSDKETWNDQLEALRFYVLTQSKKDSDPNLPMDSDEVTTRVQVLSKPEPTYTEEARQNQVVGTVVLRAVFAADGTVKHILILRALPNGLTQRAIAAARKIKFVPATLNGRSVPTFIQLEYNFNLY